MTPTMCFHLVFALGVQSEDTASPLIVIELNVGPLKKLSQMLSIPLMRNLKVIYTYIVHAVRVYIYYIIQHCTVYIYYIIQHCTDVHACIFHLY